MNELPNLHRMRPDFGFGRGVSYGMSGPEQHSQVQQNQLDGHHEIGDYGCGEKRKAV